MKFHNRKIYNRIKKCTLLAVSVMILAALFHAVPADAAEVIARISAADSESFYNYMNGEGYGPNKFEKGKTRCVLLSEFLHTAYPEINAIPADDVNEYSNDDIKWNPSQKDIDDDRDLYILEWTNGDYKNNPGSGYEILGRIVYIDDSNDVCYTPEVNIDKYARELLDLGHKQQWEQGRINQCTLAMPESCRQIVGVLMCNESGGGNNNNTWWMDSLYISRITSDKLSDIGARQKNAQGDNYCPYQNGQLVSFASAFDIGKKYLGGNDVDQEWLYLLQTPVQAVSSGQNYYAQIVTGETDLSGKDLKLTINYTSIDGNTYDYTTTINDSSVTKFYPQLKAPTYFEYDSGWRFFPGDFESAPVYRFHNLVPYASNYHGIYGFDYSVDWGKTYANPIAMEIQKVKNAQDQDDILAHLKDYGNFSKYNWETANLTETNYYAATYFGNYADYNKMKEDILGPHTATDIKLDIPHYIANINKLSLSLKAGEHAALQDIRIYTANNDDYSRTQMNGGISTERVFCDVKGALCMVSVDAPSGITLNGTGEITCTPTKGPSQTSYRMIEHSGQVMELLAADDNLGVEISIADIYEAGFDTFMADYITKLSYPDTSNVWKYDRVYSTAQMKAFLFDQLIDQKLISKQTVFELVNLMEAFYKESLTLQIKYLDDFGSTRCVDVPFITAYQLQLYSDNGGALGTSDTDHITGILQQGQDIALRVPLSQFSEVTEITLSFGKSPDGVSNFKNNKRYYYNDPTFDYSYDYLGSQRIGNWEDMIDYLSDSEYDQPSMNTVLKPLFENETFQNGTLIPNSETISIRSIRLYEHVTKDEFKTIYDKSKRVTTFHTDLDSDYYYAASDKYGIVFSPGRTLTFSVENQTLMRGDIDYSASDLKNTYLIEITGQDISGSGNVCEDIYVTLGYTTESGEQVTVNSQLLSYLARDYNGGANMSGVEDYSSASEYQTMEDLKTGYAYFTIDLDNVARFDYIHLSLKEDTENGWQANSITVYDLASLSQRYSHERHYKNIPLFTRDFEGTKVAFNNKPAALQPGQEGKTFYFTKINSDGTMESPDTDIEYTNDYLLTPPTSMTYEETLRNLGLAVTKYTYTVDVSVANVEDAGSSNYFYFQLVFENGTSGVVLANQQLTADSFRQGYTESFTIHTTQNYGNVTAVRVICDVSSANTQVFDKLNIDKITVSLPGSGGAKSWIVDKVGWIDVNYQDQGVSTTVADSSEKKGFPNSQVVKEFARTRTASTARLLFNISTAADSQNHFDNESSRYEGSLVYEDSAGYTQTYNFNLRSAIYNYNENNSSSNLFRPNMSNYFTLSLNDVTRIKSLNLYRSDGKNDWIIKDISISQFSELGDVYMSTSGEFRRYVENETLVTTSSNSNQTITGSGNATFSFEDHSISINVSNNNPATWTTTITRIPATAQESLNVYLYAGSTNYRNYTINANNPPAIKGRLEYTLREGGTTIGSQSLTFANTAEFNGTTILKATGINVTGMNQLQKLHLEASSFDQPIISGARVERIRGNTIVETLYFDFSNTEMAPGQNYTALAQADNTSSQTVQTLALQVSDSQEQLFTANSDIAVALLYTSENDTSSTPKTVYSSPNVFFSDVGITSLDNTSILEIPFTIKGADEIVGISIVSSGPNISFENALIYNYIQSNTGDRALIDSCQIARSFQVSTVPQQLLEEENTNVTPVTLKFTTSNDSEHPGSGTSGRLPLTIYYKTTNGQDAALEFSSISNQLAANTLPTAGSEIALKVHLSNFSHLTSVALNASDDDWHLYKVSAEINSIVNNTITTQQREAFVDNWITARNPVTADFGLGNDAENTQSQIISFSVTARATQSGSVETATNGNVLKLQALPGEKVTLTPQITTSGAPDNTVVWDKSQYSGYMTDDSNGGLTFTVPATHNGADAIGQVFSFTAYCSFDTQKTVTIAIEAVSDVSSTENDDTSTTPEESVTPDEIPSADVAITINQGGTMTDGPTLPSFSAEDGETQEYTLSVKPGEYIGQWNFKGIPSPEDYTISFTNQTLDITDAVNQTYLTDMTFTNADGQTVLTAEITIEVKE